VESVLSCPGLAIGAEGYRFESNIQHESTGLSLRGMEFQAFVFDSTITHLNSVDR
jgi:hypothetical protein